MWSDSDKIGTSDLVLSSSLDCSALERAELSLKRCRFFLLCPLPLLISDKPSRIFIHVKTRSVFACALSRPVYMYVVRLRSANDRRHIRSSVTLPRSRLTNRVKTQSQITTSSNVVRRISHHTHTVITCTQNTQSPHDVN